ncbi:4'-phosphopantetheinyl transferase superfamily protein [Candidatus Phytoplasma prunorum]|uniref:4'-phosphopantetheinyl transferase superfamily protein n=1 Tax=Candidatus Phytoplasma prunorum TaxID=47565 RepID=UPI002FF1A66B
MKIENIGIDIIEIKKIEKIGIEKISKRILSPEEYNIFLNINNIKRKLSFIAGRWAIKEAIFKTSYTNKNKKNNFCSYTILNNKIGAPYIQNLNKKKKIIISISHSEKYAVAFAILININ